MELRQLRYFVAVAEEQHFGRAAERLHISTPSLSQQIRALERDLHTVLLDRDHRRVALTLAGEVLLEHARVLLARAERARGEVRHAEQTRCQRVTLGLGAGAQYVLGPALNQLAEQIPGVHLIAAVTFDSEVLRAVRDERVDAGVVWVGPNDDGLAQLTLQEVPLELAMPARHRLAARAEVPVAELADETLVLFLRCFAPDGWDWLVRHLVPTDVAHPDRLLLQLHPVTTGPETMLQAVAAGKGVAPTVREAVKTAPGIVTRPLAPALHVPLKLVWRSPARPALRRIAAALRSADHPAAEGSSEAPPRDTG